MASHVSRISEELKRAKLYETFKRSDEAVEVYKQLIQTYPSDFRAHFNCARLLASQDTALEEALTLFKHVIVLDATVVEAYSAVAALSIKLNRPSEAAQHCQAGLLVNSQDQSCMYNLNIALRQIGLIEEAIGCCWDKLVHTYNIETDLTLSPQAPTGKSDESPQITVVCVKWGRKYGPEYVNNLSRAIRRHSTHACIGKLVCFTDDCCGLDSDVTCLPFDPATQTWRGWWLKAQIFAPSEHLEGWVLYVDLDTVVCDSLAFLADLLVVTTGPGNSELNVKTHAAEDETSRSASAIADTSRIYVLGAETFLNEARKVGMNSSLLLWHTRNTALHTLFAFLQRHYASLTRVIYKFDHYLEMMLYKHLQQPVGKRTATSNDVLAAPAHTWNSVSLSIMDFAGMRITSDRDSARSSSAYKSIVEVYAPAPVCCYFQDHAPGRIVDYFEYKSAPSSMHSPLAVIPSIICFPLKPKPHQLLDNAFIRHHWLGEAEVIVSAETVD